MPLLRLAGNAPSTAFPELWLPCLWHVPAQALEEGGLDMNSDQYILCALWQAS